MLGAGGRTCPESLAALLAAPSSLSLRPGRVLSQQGHPLLGDAAGAAGGGDVVLDVGSVGDGVESRALRPISEGQGH